MCRLLLLLKICFTLNKEQGLDIFKRAFSVSGVAKLQMMKRIKKETFPKQHADLYNTMRNQIVRGLSIVFTRLAIAGETKVRSHKIDNPEPVTQVLGLDANSLYLHAIAQNNPTGHFCRYKEEENCRPDPCSKFGLQAYQWLSYVYHTEEKFIQSKYNMGERRVSTHSIPVDGFCQESNQVFQFLGCFWHSCIFCNTNKNSDGSLQEIHPVKKIPHSEVQKATLENKRRLEAEGFTVIEVRECQRKQLAKRTNIAAYLKVLEVSSTKEAIVFSQNCRRSEKRYFIWIFVGGYSHTKSFKGKIQRFSSHHKKTRLCLERTLVNILEM